MRSAAEAEIGAAHKVAHQGIGIFLRLIEMGHHHPPTPIEVDITMSVGFANKTIKQKRSKAIDMRFYWLQDRSNQSQFIIY